MNPTVIVHALASACVCASVLVACGGDKATTRDSADATSADTVESNDVDPHDVAPDAIDTADAIGEPDLGLDVAVDATPDATPDTGTTPDTASPYPPEGPCDPLDASHCSFPFPSNLYLVPDAARTTGYTLDFGDALIRNSADKPIDSAPYKRMDGYGVGTPVLVGGFPNVDVTGLATERDTDPSLADADASILWFEVQADGSLKRFPYFVDIDVRETDPAKRVLIVRPAAIMREATRYVVAFRHLKDKDGHAFTASPAFAALRDGTAATDPALAPRAARFDAMFTDLATAGVAKADLQLGWDFNTASCDALHGPLRHMIDESLAGDGAHGPAFTDVEVEELVDDHWALEIRANIEVPLYMKDSPMFLSDGTVQVFNYGADGLPAKNGTAKAPVWIRIPKSAVPAPGGVAVAHGMMLYGHGQTGSGSQIRNGTFGKIADTYHYIYVATDMWGMSESDVSGIIDMLQDLSGFPRMADRLQQGLLNHVLLARAMRDQLPTLPAITERGIVLDPARLVYDGISQGGIYGASVVALSPDLQRGHLGVPGNNYGFLLPRSRNFEPFFLALANAYPERWQQVALVAIIEQIWEGSDPVSYLRHLHAEPFPDQGPNEVLLAPAKGDVEVPVASNEIAARSDLGIAVMLPYDTERNAPSGAATAIYPRTGSGIVLWDFGNPWPASSENAPPTSDAEDPHGKPRDNDNHNRQLAHFLDTGEIIDTCSDDGTPGCTPD